MPLAAVSLDVPAAAPLTAGFCAIAQLKASLGIDPLQGGLPAVRTQVAANFSAMMSLTAQLGIDLSLGVQGLPALADIPGFAAALIASLTAQLQAVLNASISLPAASMPCVPVTSSPWIPGAPTVMLGGQPMLDSTSTRQHIKVHVQLDRYDQHRLSGAGADHDPVSPIHWNSARSGDWDCPPDWPAECPVGGCLVAANRSALAIN